MKCGNVCLTGHNYQKVFGKLADKIELGDTFYIVDKTGRKVDYTVTKKIPKVDPYDTRETRQDNDNIRKVTLITCDQRWTY